MTRLATSPTPLPPPILLSSLLHRTPSNELLKQPILEFFIANSDLDLMGMYKRLP